MLAKVKSFALTGINGYALDIEVDINAGLPSYELVGLPDASVKESKERIRSAVKNSGLDYPVKKITASGSVEYPANVMLIASMNPCPCGNYGLRKQICSCSPAQVHKYLSRDVRIHYGPY